VVITESFEVCLQNHDGTLTPETGYSHTKCA